MIALLAQGRTNVGIARRLGISEKAVVHHVSRVYDVLGLTVTDDDHRRVLAVIRYLNAQRATMCCSFRAVGASAAAGAGGRGTGLRVSPSRPG